MSRGRAGLDRRDVVAARVEIDSWRWAGVPIYLRRKGDGGVT